MIQYLIDENPQFSRVVIPEDEQEQFQVYRSLVNLRPPMEIPKEYLQYEDSYLQSLMQEKGIHDISEARPAGNGLFLWKGDITTLKCGAIVNAANSGMTGCYVPCHNCIDNCIHTFSGVRLRYRCGEIMQEQGHQEPAGQAKITSAYNLPCDYVIHTVGAIVDGALTEEHCRTLANCYESCMNIACENNIESIAFCCISTGVFGFPKWEAAEIAVKTVTEFKKEHFMNVIFNVFSEEDYQIYEQILFHKDRNILTAS
ncbi:MAG TPA: protein-ADP-ribose hydrolase [Ruminococcus sp.]|nr:protein-ADP-ribose hydrolase [Ruminococcus sp.]